jgi:hypothetical protein
MRLSLVSSPKDSCDYGWQVRHHLPAGLSLEHFPQYPLLVKELFHTFIVEYSRYCNNVRLSSVRVFVLFWQQIDHGAPQASGQYLQRFHGYV